MKRKPKGRKYRNLFARGEVIYFEREANGSRVKVSMRTDDWDLAAQTRDLYTAKHGIQDGVAPVQRAEAPTFAKAAESYLAEDTRQLAHTTLAERRRALDAEGPILPALGALPLDEIDAARLRRWWAQAVEGAGKQRKTGRNYLDAISGVFRYARDLGLVEGNPADQLRAMLRGKSRTKSGRAENDPGRDVRPIESPEKLEQLLEAARGQGLEAYCATLLMLDAGLRVGEVWGLEWGKVAWGRDEDDTRRSLLVDLNRPRGRGTSVLPKSGRARTVALSRRLRGALLALYRRRESPAADARIVLTSKHTYEDREWPRIVSTAGIGHVRMKDLRDTFVSQLLTAGIQLGYVSRQAGHADIAVTARHYAKWCGGDEYREPLRLLPGEVPADLLARLCGEIHPTTIPTTRVRRPRPAKASEADKLLN